MRLREGKLGKSLNAEMLKGRREEVGRTPGDSMRAGVPHSLWKQSRIRVATGRWIPCQELSCRNRSRISPDRSARIKSMGSTP